MVDDLYLRNNPFSVNHQVAQELELGGGQLHVYASTVHLVGVLVQPRSPYTMLPYFPLVIRAAEDRADASNNLFQGEGFVT